MHTLLWLVIDSCNSCKQSILSGIIASWSAKEEEHMHKIYNSGYSTMSCRPFLHSLPVFCTYSSVVKNTAGSYNAWIVINMYPALKMVEWSWPICGNVALF